MTPFKYILATFIFTLVLFIITGIVARSSKKIADEFEAWLKRIS